MPSKSNHVPGASAAQSGKPSSRAPATSKAADAGKPAMQSSPLYAASEGEDSDAESSAHDSEPAPAKIAAAQQQVSNPLVAQVMQHAAAPADKGVKASAKPPSGRAKLAPTAASRPTGLQAKQQIKAGATKRADDAAHSFSFTPVEDEQPANPGQPKRGTAAQLRNNPDAAKPSKGKAAKQGPSADDPHLPSDEDLPSQTGMSQQQSRGQQAAQPQDSKASGMRGPAAQQRQDANATLLQLEPAAQPQDSKASGRRGPAAQEHRDTYAALLQVEGSAEDPEWLAIAEKVLDAQDMQAEAAEASAASPPVSPVRQRSPAPKHKYSPLHKRHAKVMPPSQMQPSFATWSVFHAVL